jgi:prephenate dehydrogenase
MFVLFTDVPRSRLVKYPLLIGEILRHTPPTHPDNTLLPKILSMLTKLLQQADKATGEAECEQVVNHLVFASQDPQEEYLDGASAVICSGELKDHRGNVCKICLYYINEAFIYYIIIITMMVSF